MTRFLTTAVAAALLAGCETFSPGRIDPTEGSADGPARRETGYYQGY